MERFDRPEIEFDHIKSLCTRKGWKTGRTGCFEKGSVPANKGKKMPYNAASARTQFKKGDAPRNVRKIGDESLHADGYVYLCIPERNPHTGFEHRFVPMHRYLWEQINGPVPTDHCLKAIDGDRSNTDPENWICIPRAMLPRLSGRWSLPYDSSPEELKPLILKAAELEHRARERRKEAS